MAHGPDTEKLLQRIANIKNDTLDVSDLDITSFPILPSSLQKLRCRYCLNLKSLPKLPSSLKKLDCHNTKITSLPELPSNLQELDCMFTKITSLPELPSSLQKLDCDYAPLIIQRNFRETYAEYNNRWNTYRENETKKRHKARCDILKEELVAKYYSPENIEKWSVTYNKPFDEVIEVM
jgi:Leucine-rich repeat (LRR) protein